MERDIGILKTYIVALLCSLIKERKMNNILPCAIGMITLQNSLIEDTKKALNELCAEKTISFNRTINGVAFETISAN